ncbi:MAG: enoyl-CoA hydratase/isomerase family protein [Burkholderiaceae bacterium]
MGNAVVIRKHAACVELVLNRPDHKNAIDLDMADQLATAIESVNDDDDTRVVILRGEGGAFCSGLDLNMLKSGPDARARFSTLWNRVHTGLIRSDKVFIAAMERFAVNGAASLAIAADFLICGRSAFLQIGEIKLGMAAPRNLAWLALRHSEAVAARLCLIGDRVDAQELYRLGIANEVVADDEVIERARALAERIAAHPANGIRVIKQGIRAAFCRRPPAAWFEACEVSDL